ncbi:MAG TPA: hypothetical protein VGF76_08895 [Polyangiaceae bacterium]
MKRWSARAVFATVALPLLLCVACGGQARQSAADAGAGNPDAGATASGGGCAGKPIPKEHRAVAEACPTERGTKEPIDMSICTDLSGAKCTKDADCTAGKNGRCILPHDEPCDTKCSYDECQTDSDCAAGPCVCRTSGADATNNVCLPGSNCETDSNCGNCGYCSLSATPIGHDCRVDYPTYNCHTATDECLDPTDCADGGLDYCAYGASAASGVEHWACGSCLPYPVP